MFKIAFFSLIWVLPLILHSQSITNPRSPAEWEEVGAFVMEAMIIRGHPDVPWDEAIDPYVKAAEVCINEGIDFYVLDPDSADGQPDGIDMDTVFTNRGLVSSLIHIIPVSSANAFNSPWARDHGPFIVYDNYFGETKIMGFPGDTTAHFMADYLGKTYIEIPQPFDRDQYFDGGNWLTDGHGTFNICNVFNSNITSGLVNPAIPAFKDYLGSQQTLNVKGVGVHADYWIKMINEKTFLVSHIPQSNYDPNIDNYFEHELDIQAGIEAIQIELENAFGGGFKFHYITNAPTFDSTAINTTYLTADASYINSVILNKTVIVPQFVSQPFDSNALKIYREIMPGYNIVGANCRQIAMGSGAMHCISREIFADNPIYITHDWYPDSLNQLTDYQVDAIIQTTAVVDSAILFWSTDTSVGFQSMAMNLMGNNIYQAFIPGQPYNSIIHYYIQVNTNNGKIVRKPMVSPYGTYSFLIHPDGTTRIKLTGTKPVIPEQLFLNYNYPNPFNSSTLISYILPKRSKITLIIYNILGQKVRLLVNQIQNQGGYSAKWDGTDDAGIPVSSGVYVYRLSDGRNSKVCKMVLLR